MNPFNKNTFLLIKKDYKNFNKNSENMGVCILPLFFTFFYKNQIPNDLLLSFASIINLSMVPCMLIASQIAQEKELDTLYTLRISGVTSNVFLTSKILFSMSFYVIISIGIYFILGIPIVKIFPYIVLSIFCSIPIIVLGGIIGIASKNQMSSNMLQFPFSIFLMLPLLVSNPDESQSFLDNWIRIIPTESYQLLINKYIFENEVSSIFSNVTLIFSYSTIMIIVFTLFYKKINVFRMFKR